MATTGVVNGTDIFVYVDGTAVAYSDSASLSISGPGTIPLSHKDMGTHLEKLQQKGYTWTMSVSGLYAIDSSSKNTKDIFDAIRTNSSVVLKFATETANDRYYTGTAAVTGLSWDAPHNDNSTFSADFEGIDRLISYVT